MQDVRDCMILRHTCVMVDFDKLRYAVTVAREGSFSAAAVTIPISQSALTRSIQSLEREYGLRIFDRGKAGTRLTADGAIFITRAESLLQHADAMEHELHAVSTGQRMTLSFGMAPVTASLCLPDALPTLLGDGTEVRSRIRIGSNSMLRDLLQRSEIEFYVGGVPRDSDNFLTSAGLRMEKIAGSSRLLLVVRQGHPLADVAITHDMLTRYPVVSPPFVRDTLQNADIEALGIARPTIELDDYSLLTQLVRNSDSILVTSSIFSTHPRSQDFITLPLSLTPIRPVTYSLITRADRELTPASRAIADMLIELVGRTLASSTL